MDDLETGTTSGEEIEISIEDTIRDTLRDIESRPRDEFGRFAKQAQEATEIEDGDLDETEGLTDDLQEEEPEATETVAEALQDKAPSSWRKEAAAEWAKIPPTVKAEIQKREQDIQKGIIQKNQQLEQYKFAAEWAKQFEPLSQDLYKLRQAYGSEFAGLKNLLQISDYANKDPQGFVQWFAKQRGIPLQGNAEPATPEQAEYSRLQQEVAQLKASIQAQKDQQEREVFSNLYREIEDTKSKPGFEHFEELRGEMAGILQAGLAQSLPEAYEKALWIRPDLRQSLIAKQQEEAANKAKAEALAKAKAAQKAGQVNVARRGQVSTTAPIGTMEDSIRENAKRLGFFG